MKNSEWHRLRAHIKNCLEAVQPGDYETGLWIADEWEERAAEAVMALLDSEGAAIEWAHDYFGVPATEEPA